MANGERLNLPHLFPRETGFRERFTSPRSAPRNTRTFDRPRRQHGEHLARQLHELANTTIPRLREERRNSGASDDGFIYLEFESDVDAELTIDRLENLPSGIDLLAVSQRDGRVVASVLVPEDKLAFFIGRVEQYIEEDTNSGLPRHYELVGSVANVRAAAIEALWTDDPDLIPPPGEHAWWEVWVRRGPNENDYLEQFRQFAEAAGIRVGGRHLEFTERSVVLAFCTREDLARSIELIDSLAELRGAKLTADLFDGRDLEFERQVLQDIEARIVVDPESTTACCLLDTGVNWGHPLIAPHLAEQDAHSCVAGWPPTDHHSHGTAMAGVALYGDLADVISAYGPVFVPYRLESVVLLPPPAFAPNDPALYGELMLESIARAEVQAPHRHRVISMAVGASDYRDRGKPSSWSAAADYACFPSETSPTGRLLLIAAGNVSQMFRADEYPATNFTESIHDPGQSWNALTVGATTEKNEIANRGEAGLEPLAPPLDLGPKSCTSNEWNHTWPIKPDVVIEGGNLALNPVTNMVDEVDSLQLLSTNWRPADRLFLTTAETSAATSLLAGWCARVMHDYPEILPETVRGLVVHSASWAPQMIERASDGGQLNKRVLLRTFGYGKPDLERASISLQSRATLIVEDQLQPFVRDGGRERSNEMALHRFPWPSTVLEQLGDREVSLRVTLSYFIEPNPSGRGYERKHQYASHGLRFDVKGALESVDEFRRRINKAADIGEPRQRLADSGEWFLGPQLRARGSILSDIWSGEAAALSEKDSIAVYPVTGWWRDRPRQGKVSSTARYSLILTLECADADVDLYTEIQAAIAVPTPVEVGA